MMTNESVNVWLSIPSFLVRKTLVSLLRQKNKNIKIQEWEDTNIPIEMMIRFSPDMVIVDENFYPSFGQLNSHALFSFLSKTIPICSLTTKAKSSFKEGFFHQTISIYDSPEFIWSKIESILFQPESEQQKFISEDLSEREKEVLLELVNGYTNKEIGNHLNLSVHTVITHRKNITRKLDIKSTAGLTIYAIMNNIISIDQIKER